LDLPIIGLRCAFLLFFSDKSLWDDRKPGDRHWDPSWLYSQYTVASFADDVGIFSPNGILAPQLDGNVNTIHDGNVS